MASQAAHSGQEMPIFTREIFEVLKQCATDGNTIAYGILANHVVGANARAESTFRALDYIRDNICLPRELPWLWMLAVNQRSGKPGSGAWRGTGTKLRDEDHWNEILRSVYAYDWSNIEIEDK